MPWDPIYWEAGRELRSFGYPFIYRDIPLDIPRYLSLYIDRDTQACRKLGSIEDPPQRTTRSFECAEYKRVSQCLQRQIPKYRCIYCTNEHGDQLCKRDREFFMAE